MAKVIGRAIARHRAYYPVAPGSAHCDLVEVGQEFTVLEGHEGNWYDMLPSEQKPEGEEPAVRARKPRAKTDSADDLA